MQFARGQFSMTGLSGAKGQKQKALAAKVRKLIDPYDMLSTTKRPRIVGLPMPPQPNGSLLRFGVFDLDHQTCVLRKNGRPLKLQPQPAKVLALLVARPNELITREELHEQIWGNGSYGDFEHALNVC